MQYPLQTKSIISTLADAAQRWNLPDFPPRFQTAHAIVQRLDYTPPVVTLALDRLFGSITQETIEATIVDELGSLQALDGFVPRRGRPAVFARGLDNVLIVSSDTTIGVAIPPMIFALCANAHVLVKDRSDHLVAAFAQTLFEEEPALANLLHVQTWENHEASHEVIARADVVVAFGRDATMRAIREQCNPGARFLPFGHRTSLAYIPREALADETEALQYAREAALDALLYDGEGCLSTHAIFAETGAPITPRAFAALFAQACNETALRFPYAGQEITPSVAAYRDRALFRQAQGHGEIHGGANGVTHLVAFEPPMNEPPPFLPRTVGVYSAHDPTDMLRYVRTHALALEAIATTPPPRGDLMETFIASGATRIAALGTLQDPPLTGNHGGQGRITPFVRFVYRDDAHA